MSKDQLDIIGIGNAIVDVLSKTDDDFLNVHQINKGTMTLIEEDQAKELYSKMPPGTAVSGGSVANTIAGFASLGGKAGFIGKVANDQLGEVFRHDMEALGVSYDTHVLDDGPATARCLIMVTPDAQRTMCTYLGASVWFSPNDLDKDIISNAKITYLEGYLFDKPKAKQAFRTACEIAHEAGKKVALSLSDPFCVERHRAEFLDLVENHIDILFANEHEILSLYQEDNFDVVVHKVKEYCEIAALTRSEKGSVIVTPDKETIEIPVHPVEKVVDTTGAGDMYAAGFLYGYTRGMDLAECGRIASIAAAEVISHLGARPQTDLLELISKHKKSA